ncbi:PIN domain-containing protein [Endozoicomonas lisbonensis]|uniref:Ribonuclease VapC n=1 Tax=Endozoicomonas lisbonensis TaxID=3120522 RepID=A0ABV2SH10_9GAMM
MVLVDTCVWSAALRRKKTPVAPEEARILKRLIQQHRAVMIGPVLQEVLTGIRYEEQFQRLQAKLTAFELLTITSDDFIQAARYSSLCRSKGVQGSHTDYLIATIGIKYKIPVFTTDNDFNHYRKHIPVQLFARPEDFS